MRRLLVLTCLLLLATPSPASAGTARAYVTPLIAHTAWTATDGCEPVPGVVTLPKVLAAHARRGYHPSGTLITGWIRPATRTCIEHLALKPYPKPILLPSWRDLRRLHAADPWFGLASGGIHYRELTVLSPSQQIAEACGSAAAIIDHGWRSPLPLFAYPNNRVTAVINARVLAKCPYTLGRHYSGEANTRRSIRSGFLRVYSINGGRCRDTALRCSHLDTRFAYTRPAELAARLHPAPGRWVVPQIYRLVTGSRPTGRLRWNCRGPAGSHFTYDRGGDSTELYCARDYFAALAHQPGYVVTGRTIRGVEQLWGL
ncbi:MAG TPA: hypothetical protein VFH74_00750 [Gaiellales bacterium]|nr:hypothetical protein [Gaiellales bacterium]